MWCAAGAFAQGLKSSFASVAGDGGVDLKPLAAAGQSLAKAPGQGFMPYKWHAQQACGAQQLQPGVFSLGGKRSASASFAVPPRKRAHSAAMP